MKEKTPKWESFTNYLLRKKLEEKRIEELLELHKAEPLTQILIKLREKTNKNYIL